MKPHNIKLSPAAKEAARALAKEGYILQFRAAPQGCCTLAVRITPVPDPAHEPAASPESVAFSATLPESASVRTSVPAGTILTIDGIRLLMDNAFPDFTWVGTIEYKEKGLHKGFHWR